MEDLTKYTKQELSLRVFNDEELYLKRHQEGFIENVLIPLFNFTQEQKQELIRDLNNDFKEV